MLNGVYDSSKLNDIVLNLEKAMIEFDTLITASKSLDIPDFVYANYLRSLPALISDCKNDCNSNIEWAKSVMNNFENYSTGTIDSLSKVEVYGDFSKQYNINLL